MQNTRQNSVESELATVRKPHAAIGPLDWGSFSSSSEERSGFMSLPSPRRGKLARAPAETADFQFAAFNPKAYVEIEEP
jgi:hypothetical protein